METARGSVEVRDPSKPQQAAARRVAESKATIPHLYLDAAIQIRAAVEPRDLVARVVKASASALREHPAVNGAYRDGRFEAYSRINIGIVLAGRDGTVVPTIFDADTLELDEIASVLAELEADAGEGSLTSPQLAGGTFTIISVAQHAVTRLTPVIHAGQAAMLALGGISHTGVVATLACDHRIVSVHEAAAFLARVSALFEDG